MTRKALTPPGRLHGLLFRLDPERAHDLALGALRAARLSGVGLSWLRRRFRLDHGARLSQRLLGLELSNPLGLAAGFDKNAAAVDGLAALGFGFLEVGTVTPLAQPGNPKPRVFRHPARASLQNALGFNNQGMESMAGRLLAAAPFPLPVGVNIGKNAATPLERAESDYRKLFHRFARLADYFVVNISSPNTPGLRDLQAPETIAALVGLGRELTERPVLVKLSPDLEPKVAIDLGRVATEAGASGLIVTNTTTDYSLIEGAGEFGGLSGEVLKERSFSVLQALAAELYGETLLISVGGIDSAAEAYRRLRAGASLVQVYTALVYQGAGLVRSILGGLVELLDRDNLENIGEAVGKDLAN
jgi:dihydroorotate dehydrogenase